jgi:DNA repair protein RadC
MKESRKRVDIVKIKMCKERSILYSPRKITSPSDAVNLIHNVLDGADREKFLVIALDTKNQPIAVDICSVGSLNSTIVHPREVFKMAILANAASVLLAHNHRMTRS